MKVRYLIIMLFSLVLLTSCVEEDINVQNQEINDLKPVIYLYPDEETKVNVTLDYNGELTCTYPQSEGTWEVLAKPDGTLFDLNDNKEYSYLFWEGISKMDYDFTEGFIVKGEDTKDFLQEKLEYMGLTPREYNEFIVFWLPQMQSNKYNLISFQFENYTNNAKLTITPKPDSILRVYMAYMPIDKPFEIKEQKLKSFKRDGFTVIEWGGSEVNN